MQEGFPVALMEAMESRLPIICSNIRGNTYLIENKRGGYLCSPGSIEEFSTSIKKFSCNKEMMYKMGTYNTNIIQKFDINIVSKKLKKYI